MDNKRVYSGIYGGIKLEEESRLKLLECIKRKNKNIDITKYDTSLSWFFKLCYIKNCNKAKLLSHPTFRILSKHLDEGISFGVNILTFNGCYCAKINDYSHIYKDVMMYYSDFKSSSLILAKDKKGISQHFNYHYIAYRYWYYAGYVGECKDIKGKYCIVDQNYLSSTDHEKGLIYV